MHNRRRGSEPPAVLALVLAREAPKSEDVHFASRVRTLSSTFIKLI
jgi:hypothetical protein